MDILHVVATNWKLNEDRLLIIFPLFFAYFLGSFLNLRVWLAAQKVPAVAKSEVREEDPEKLYQRSSFVLFAILCLLVVSVFWEPLLDVIFVSITLIASSSLVMHLLVLLVGFRLSIHLNPSRALTIYLRFKDYTIKRQLLFLVLALLGVGLQIAVIFFRNNVGASVMLATALYTFQVLPIRRMQVSMRHMIKRVIMYEAILLLHKAAYFIIIRFTDQNDKEASVEQLHGSHSDDFSDWFYIAIVAYPVSLIFSLFLRFDFANHIAGVEAIQDSPANIALEEVPAPPASPEKQLTAGVVVPSAIPFSFKRPYFNSAFLAWFIANFAVAQLTTHGLFLNTGRLSHAIGVLYISPPMMVLSVVIVSMVRGEVGRMWGFGEQWGPEPIVRNAVVDSEKTKELVDVGKGPTQFV
jgi:hypothetical protein